MHFPCGSLLARPCPAAATHKHVSGELPSIAEVKDDDLLLTLLDVGAKLELPVQIHLDVIIHHVGLANPEFAVV